jgi:hypothetical protein
MLSSAALAMWPLPVPRVRPMSRPRAVAGLPEQRCLLVARDAGQRDRTGAEADLPARRALAQPRRVVGDADGGEVVRTHGRVAQRVGHDLEFALSKNTSASIAPSPQVPYGQPSSPAAGSEDARLASRNSGASVAATISIPDTSP